MIKISIIENNADNALVSFNGEWDSAASNGCNEKLQPVMENASRTITFDFSKLEFISSAGLRVLLVFKKQIDANGGKIIIKGMSEDIRQIFQISGFDAFFEIV